MTLKIGDIVKRPDGKIYQLIPDQGHISEGPQRAFNFVSVDGYLTVGDAKMENLEKVGESS